MLGSAGFETGRLASLEQVKELNAFFIEREHASGTYIQSPANWNLTQIAESLSSNRELLTACKI